MYPSIDLLEGKAVRLRKGQPSEAKVYSTDPLGLARSLSTGGIGGLHIVDLDAAFGRGNNLGIISEMINSVNVPVQVGGGIRTEGIASRLIEAGADALVIGTVALTDETVFREISATTGKSRIIVALDYAGDNVLIEGWRKQSGIRLLQALHSLTGVGVHSFLLTSADRDGMMEGPDVDTIKLVCRTYGDERIFASGGVTSTEDIGALRDAGAFAVIVGKALLEGALSITEAIRVAAG